MRTESEINTVVQKLLDQIREIPNAGLVSTAKLLSGSGYDLDELQDGLQEILCSRHVHGCAKAIPQHVPICVLIEVDGFHYEL